MAAIKISCPKENKKKELKSILGRLFKGKSE
jgi:hypothetical protein